MIGDNGGPIAVDAAAVEAARLAGIKAREDRDARAQANGHESGAEDLADTPAAPPAAPEFEIGVPRGGAEVPEAAPCGPCEDGLTIGLPRTAERALGILGCAVGVVLILMGVDLATGGALSRLVGLGGSDDDGNPGAR